MCILCTFVHVCASLVPRPLPLLQAGEGLVTSAIKTVAGSYIMLHNHIAVSAPCHVIAVMKDDDVIRSSSYSESDSGKADQ